MLSKFFWLLFLVPFSAYCDQLIIEPDMGRAPIVKALNTAQQIDLVMYGFSDKDLLQNFIDLSRYKKIRIILQDKPYKMEQQNEFALERLQRAHIPFKTKIAHYRLIHQKTLILDNHAVIVMTFNFTNSTFKKKIRNFALILNEPEVVNNIAAIFKSDWNNKPTHYVSDRLLLSPDNSRQRLLQLIKNSKHSIQIYAQTLNDFEIAGALMNAAKHGVHIQLLVSNKIPQRQEDFLRHAKVQIKYSKNIYIHAKAFIFDNHKILLGSINLSKASLNDNRELAAISTDKQVVKQLQATFQKDWGGNDALFDQTEKPAAEKNDWQKHLKQVLEFASNYLYKKIMKFN